MIYLIGVVVIVLGSVGAVFGKNAKQSGVFLWFAGLGLGAVFLHFGAEVLAFVQWILGTLTAIVITLHATMLGGEEPQAKRPMVALFPTLFFGLFFSLLILVSTEGLRFTGEQKMTDSAATLGKFLVEHYPILLPLLGVGLLLLIVGNGVLSRLERTNGEA